MAEEDYEIYAKFIADTQEFEKGVKRIISETNKANKSTLNFKKILSSIGLAGGGIALVTKSIKATTQAFKECLQASDTYEKGQRILQQTLKVTGAETWTNIKALNEMQTQLSQTTNYSTSEIQQLQTVLLGFKSIKGDVFDQTTNAILDMATVMGMDLTNATQAVAKALDDPIKGLGSLSRQGFAFTESQKEMIQNLIDTGEKAKAQQIILDELYSTYGGASQSALDSSTRLKNAVTDLKTEIGKSFSENMKPMQEFFTELIQGWANAKKAKNEYDKAVKSEDKTIEDWEIIIKKESKEIENKRARYEQAQKIIQMTNAEIKKTAEYIEWSMYSESGSPIDDFIQAQKDLIHNFEYEEIILDNHQHALADLKEQEEKRLELLRQEQEEQERITEELEKQKAQEEERRKEEEKWKEMIKLTSDIIKQDIETNAEDTKNTIDGYINELSEKAEDAFNFDWDKLSGLNSFFKDIGKSIDNNIGNKIKGLLSEAGKIGEGAKEKISQITNKASQDISKITAEMSAGLIDPTQAKSKIELIKANATEAIKEVRETTGKSVDKIGKKIKSIMITQTILHLSTQVTSIVSANVQGVIKGIETAVQYGVKAVKEAFNVIQKLVDFNFDDFIDKMLKFEDKLLTFIVNIRDEIPNFVETVLSSIGHTLASIDEYLTADDVKTMVYGVLKSISDNLPSILKSLSGIISNILHGIVQALSDWIDSGGFDELLDSLLEFQKELEDAVVSVLHHLLPVVKKAMPKIIEMIKNSIISASETLSELIPDLVSLIIEIINLIIAIVTDKDIIQSSFPVIVKLIQAIIEQILPAIFDIFNNLISTDMGDIGNLIGTFIQSIINGLMSADFGKLLTSFMGFLTTAITKNPIEDFTKLIYGFIDGLVSGIKKADWGSFWEELGNMFKNAFEALGQLCYSLFIKPFSSMFDDVGNIFDGDASAEEKWKSVGNIFTGGLVGGLSDDREWYKKVLDPFGWFATGVNNAPRGLAVVGEQGPELIDFKGGERVYTAQNTKGILSGVTSGGNSFNVTFNNVQDTSAYTMIKQLKNYNRQMAINGVL